MTENGTKKRSSHTDGWEDIHARTEFLFTFSLSSILFFATLPVHQFFSSLFVCLSASRIESLKLDLQFALFFRLWNISRLLSVLCVFVLLSFFSHLKSLVVLSLLFALCCRNDCFVYLFPIPISILPLNKFFLFFFIFNACYSSVLCTCVHISGRSSLFSGSCSHAKNQWRLGGLQLKAICLPSLPLSLCLYESLFLHVCVCESHNVCQRNHSHRKRDRQEDEEWVNALMQGMKEGSFLYFSLPDQVKKKGKEMSIKNE